MRGSMPRQPSPYQPELMLTGIDDAADTGMEPEAESDDPDDDVAQGWRTPDAAREVMPRVAARRDTTM
jgi:hypothetical protein